MDRNRGFVKAIVLIVILLAVLAYWGFDIKDALSSPAFKEKISFIWNWIKDLWLNYVWHWFEWLWDHVIRPLLEKVRFVTPELPPETSSQA